MKNKTDNTAKKSNLKRFASYYKPHIGMFTVDMLCALFISSVDIAYPLLSKLALDRYLSATAPQYRPFFILMAVCFLLYILRTGATYIVTALGHRLGVHIEADMRRDAFTHLQQLGFSFYDKSRTGKLLSRCTNDLFDVTELAHHGPEDVFISMLTFIGAFVVMLTIEWRLALVLIAVVPVMLIFVMNLRKRMSRTSRKVKEGMAVINSQIESSISGARVAKAFTNEDYEISKFEQGNGIFVNSKSAYYKTMGMFMAGMEFFTTILNVIVLAVSGVLIMKGEMTTTTLIIFMMYISSFVTPIRKLSAFAEQYTMGMAGFKRFTELLDTKAEIQDKPDAIELKNVKGDIEFKNISFAYGSGGNVLENICLSIRHGQTLALVGPSGGGKSTVAKLIARFWDVSGGSVEIGGVNVKDMPLSQLSEYVSFVTQDNFLFRCSLLENIRLGNPSTTEEEVKAAARAAQCEEFIAKLPQGYDTPAGEAGKRLSGGEKQRIAIARMLLKNAPIVILDEATAFTDPENEDKIQRSIAALTKGKTLLVIAHRLSTIQNADNIVVLRNGAIEAQGKQAELLETCPLYREMWLAHIGAKDWAVSAAEKEA